MHSSLGLPLVFVTHVALWDSSRLGSNSFALLLGRKGGQWQRALQLLELVENQKMELCVISCADGSLNAALSHRGLDL